MIDHILPSIISRKPASCGLFLFMATPLKVCSLLILISFVSCKSDSESTEESSLGISARFPDHTELLATDLKKPSEAPETKTLFESIDATAAGMDFVHRWELNKKTVKLFDRIEAGGGVTIGDVDGDGLPDVFLTRPLDGARLYRNLGGFKFEDITNSAGLEQPNDQWPTGASFADIDNDGDLDLAICGFDCPTQLYINDGKGVFSDQAAELGFDFKGAGIMVAFSDYDRDGDLDAFLATHRYAVDLLDPRYDQGNFVVGFHVPWSPMEKRSSLTIWTNSGEPSNALDKSPGSFEPDNAAGYSAMTETNSPRLETKPDSMTAG